MTEQEMKETLEKQLQLLSERSGEGDSEWHTQVTAVVDAFLGKVIEKINRDDCTTDMLYEDIRILHHIVKIQKEIYGYSRACTFKNSIRQDLLERQEPYHPAHPNHSTRLHACIHRLRQRLGIDKHRK